jgi:catechol 2,3-dioxygenase-like lactoylglutathione lyase family enzyme
MTSSNDPADQPFARPTGLHHVRLSVSDVERSRVFYTRLLGSEPRIDQRSQLSDPTVVDDPQRFFGGVVYQVGDHVLGLRPVPAEPGERFSPKRIGLDHVSLAVSSRTDLDDAAARLTAAGVDHGEIIELEEQGLAILSLQDPDDINLELTAPLHS